MVANALSGASLLFRILAHVAILFVITRGFATTSLHSTVHEVDPTLTGLLYDGLRKLPKRAPTRGPSFLAFSVLPGYNCRGYVWIGKAQVHTVWDTGSSRNSIDKGYLEAVLRTKGTKECVMDVKKITPLKCRSVDKKNPITIKHVAEIECEFKSSSNRSTGSESSTMVFRHQGQLRGSHFRETDP